jgi:DNA replication protein DnaC
VSIEREICPICHGAGYLTKDVPVGHPDFGKLFPCRCKAQELEQRRGDRLRQVSNLSHLDYMTFDSFIPEGRALNELQQGNLRRAYEAALSYAREPRGWLLFRGGYGSGKTHLAAAIANYRLDGGQPAVFVVIPDLLDHLRGAYSPHSDTSYDERFAEVRDCPLLILDDLGTESNTPWADEKLFQIFNYRYNAKLPTVITTNSELEEIDPRIRSRLTTIDLVQTISIMAPDYRASGIDPTQSELSSLGFHSDKTFASFNVHREDLDAEGHGNLLRVARAAHEFAEHPIGWFVLTGAYGCGKTHLAAAIANHQLAKRRTALFVVVPDLLDHLRSTFSPQSPISYDKLFDQVRRAPLLILDDLGTESATSWAKEKLYQLFNHRYSARLPTVITTSREIDDLDPRLRSRLLDPARCQIWLIKAPAFRGVQPGTALHGARNAQAPPSQTRTRRRRY